MTKLFNLDQAAERFCIMETYSIHHPTLEIKILANETDRQHFIRFLEVVYIEGATTWAGAEFTAKSAEESFKFALSLGRRGMNLGDFRLSEAKVNQRSTKTPYKLVAILYKWYLTLKSALPFTDYKQRYVRILAKSCTLDNQVISHSPQI